MAVVQQHDVIIGQVVLTEVWALLWHGEITLLIGTPEGERGRRRKWTRGQRREERRGEGQTGSSRWVALQWLHSPEEPSVFHIICIFVVLLLRSNPHPEEVLWLLPLVNHLGDKVISLTISCKKKRQLHRCFIWLYTLFIERIVALVFLRLSSQHISAATGKMLPKILEWNSWGSSYKHISQ